MEKKYQKAKKYTKELEEGILKKDRQIKEMKLQKKNDDLCSQMESALGGGLANELQDFDYKPQSSNQPA